MGSDGENSATLRGTEALLNGGWSLLNRLTFGSETLLIRVRSNHAETSSLPQPGGLHLHIVGLVPLNNIQQ